MEFDSSRMAVMFIVVKERDRLNKFLSEKMDEFWKYRSKFWSIYITPVGVTAKSKECRIFVVPWFLSNLKDYQDTQYFLRRTLQGDGAFVIRKVMNELLERMKKAESYKNRLDI